MRIKIKLKIVLSKLIWVLSDFEFRGNFVIKDTRVNCDNILPKLKSIFCFVQFKALKEKYYLNRVFDFVPKKNEIVFACYPFYNCLVHCQKAYEADLFARFISNL